MAELGCHQCCCSGADAMKGDLLGTGGNVIEALHHCIAARVHRTGGIGNGRVEFIKLRSETCIIEADSES
jgi:hypothetical protein